MSEITHGILEQTLVMFGTIKEGIVELLDEHLGAFRTEILAIVGACTLTFLEFHVRGDPEFFRKKHPVVSRKWIVDMTNAFRTSFFPEGSKVWHVAGCLRERARDWWESVGDSLGASAIEAMTWSEFVARFREKFALTVEL